jgi:hypothetical protein
MVGDGLNSEWCPVAGFGIVDIQLSGSAAEMLVSPQEDLTRLPCLVMSFSVPRP